jgi:hypothetical protein
MYPSLVRESSIVSSILRALPAWVSDASILPIWALMKIIWICASRWSMGVRDVLPRIFS